MGPDDRPRYFIQIVTPGGELLANVNTYPAYGALSTSYLPQGTAVHESYELPVNKPVPAGSRLLLGSGAPMRANDCRLSMRPASPSPIPPTPRPWPPS